MARTKRWRLIRAFVVVGTVPALAATNLEDEVKAAIQNLPSSEKFKADSYVVVAVILQELGKEKTNRVLKEISESEDERHDDKIFILCRMLYKAKKEESFRRPQCGGPLFFAPKPSGLDAWPLEPIELIDGVPFQIVDGYVLAGKGESPGHYLKYCIENCDWNDEKFKPKTQEEKRKALEKLVSTPRGKKPLTEEEMKTWAKQMEPQIQ